MCSPRHSPYDGRSGRGGRSRKQTRRSRGSRWNKSSRRSSRHSWRSQPVRRHHHSRRENHGSRSRSCYYRGRCGRSSRSCTHRHWRNQLGGGVLAYHGGTDGERATERSASGKDTNQQRWRRGSNPPAPKWQKRQLQRIGVTLARGRAAVLLAALRRGDSENVMIDENVARREVETMEWSADVGAGSQATAAAEMQRWA